MPKSSEAPVERPFGSSPRMGIATASRSTSGTIPPIDTGTGARASSLPVPAKSSSSATPRPRRYSSGGNSSTPAASVGSTAPSSETKALRSRQSLSDRLTQSLITAGLVRGITPTSVRRRSGQPMLDFAFSKLDGVDAE